MALMALHYDAQMQKTKRLMNIKIHKPFLKG